MLSQRLFFGALMIAALLGLLYVDHHFAGPLQLGPRAIRHEGLVVALVLAVLAVMGTVEMGRLAEAAGHAPLRLWAAMSNYLVLMLLYFSHNGLLAPAIDSGPGGLTLAWLIVTFLGTAILIAARERVQRSISDLAVSLLIVVYLGLMPTFLLRIRMEGSVGLLLFFVASVKCCDIGAYFTGRYLGRHKLIPWLSPGKTIEGLVGGVMFSGLVALGLARLGLTDIPMSHSESVSLPPVSAFAFGAVIGLIGQGGDLLESLFKRDAEAKDSSSALPAFGGVLDILDSLLPAAPLAYAYLIQWR